jgi:hypothetical protein
VSTLVLIFPMLLSNPGHIQYIAYPTRNACMKSLARQDPLVIDKDFSFCKPSPLEPNANKLTLTPQFENAILRYANKPQNEYHN